MLLEGRVAVVTGAGRGLGREYALCLAREGAAVVVNDLGVESSGGAAKQDPAEQVCAEIEAAGGRAVASRDSVSDFKAAKRIVQTAVKSFGRLDILVNNAGILRNARLLRMTEKNFDAVIDVHLKGTFNMARHAATVMSDQGYGRIVNITSGGGLQGNPGHTNYGAAKAGIVGMTYVWALELAKFGITVNALAPMGETQMTVRKLERMGNVGRRVSDPALNAPMVAYLASERAGHVSGQVFGRMGYSFAIYQRPEPIASMWQHGEWEPEQLAHRFDQVLGRHLQPVGRAGRRFERRKRTEKS